MNDYFSGPKSGARAVRLVHGYEVDGKKLVAKVDAKNQQLLDTAKDEENKKSDANNTRTSDAATEKKNDDLTLDRLAQILDEYKEELKAANSAESKLTIQKMFSYLSPHSCIRSIGTSSEQANNAFN